MTEMWVFSKQSKVPMLSLNDMLRPFELSLRTIRPFSRKGCPPLLLIHHLRTQVQQRSVVCILNLQHRYILPCEVTIKLVLQFEQTGCVQSLLWTILKKKTMMVVIKSGSSNKIFVILCYRYSLQFYSCDGSAEGKWLYLLQCLLANDCLLS